MGDPTLCSSYEVTVTKSSDSDRETSKVELTNVAQSNRDPCVSLPHKARNAEAPQQLDIYAAHAEQTAGHSKGQKAGTVVKLGTDSQGGKATASTPRLS